MFICDDGYTYRSTIEDANVVSDRRGADAGECLSENDRLLFFKNEESSRYFDSWRVRFVSQIINPSL